MSEHDDKARDLARFLDTGSSEHAAALDEDVREALFAMRPDLAPAPRTTAEDILATVRRGPLADPVASATPASARSREGAEVVTFPGAADDEPSSYESVEVTVPTGPPKPAPPRRRWALVGGASGVGLLLAAAATLLLVSRPTLYGADERAPTASRPAVAAPAEEVDADPTAASETRDEIAAAERRTEGGPEIAVGRARPRVDVESVASRGVRPRSVQGEASVEAKSSEVQIPEVTKDAPSEPDPVTPQDLDQLRALARPRDRVPDAWRSELTVARLAVLDETLAAARAAREAGDPGLAGDLLEPLASRAPARVAQHFAGLAAVDFLAAQQAGRAVAVARQGLAQGTANTPERSHLLYLLGLALEAKGARDTAAAAFEEARLANEAR